MVPVAARLLGQVGLPGLTGLGGPVLAAASFLLVVAAGAALANWRTAAVDRAVDRTTEMSPVAVIYGLVAFALVIVIGAYLLTQVTRIGVGGVALRWVGALVVGSALVVLGSFGYLVLGTVITDVEGARRPLVGAVVGAVASALPWLVLPPLPALGVWVLLAAVGLGAPTRHYIHGDRSVRVEPR